MPTLPPPPQLDARSKEDLVRFLIAKLQADAGWTPRSDGSFDTGSALVHVFARMMEQLLAGLNQVPEQHYRAFLDLLGAERIPPQPARVPITFVPAAGSLIEPLVPVHTPVAAPAEGEQPELVFYTEAELATTRAELIAAYVVRQDLLWAQDVTALVTGATAGQFALPGSLGGSPFSNSSHAQQYLFACDSLFLRNDLKNLSITFAFETEAAALSLNASAVKWGWWDGHTGDETPQSCQANRATLGWRFDLIPKPFDASARRRWLVAILPQQRAMTVTATATLQAQTELSPTVLLHNGNPLDPARDFMPLGSAPRPGDVLYVGGHAELLQAGAEVKIAVSLSDSLIRDSQSLLAASGLEIRWEVYTRSGWSRLAAGLDLTTSAVMNISLPKEVGTTVINGVADIWLRASVIAGGYGAAASQLATVAPPTVTLAAAGTTLWSYSVIAISAAGAIASSSPSTTTRGPEALATDKFNQLSWPAIAGAASYAVYRLAGPATLGSGCIGITTSPFFVDAGGPASTLPLSTIAPARPSLKALTLSFEKVTLSAVHCVVSQRDLSDEAVYLGFDRPFGEQPVSLFLALDPARPEEVKPEAPRLSLPSLLSIAAVGPTPGSSTPLAIEDGTAGLVRSGLVTFVASPRQTSVSLFQRPPCYWLCLRISSGGLPERRLHRLLTNTTWATHARTVTHELLGSSDGSTDQTFRLSQKPILAGEAIEVREVGATSGEGWTRWQAVPDFHGSAAHDPHYVIDRVSGTLCFGDGRSGRIPMAGAQNIRASCYRTGGGSAGNRAALKINQLRASIAYLDRAVNLLPADGGSEAEEIERMKARSATRLRHGGRAVTLQDFEDLALMASSAVARARAIGPHSAPASGQLRVPVQLIIVPASPAAQPTPGLELLEIVRAFLQARSAPFVDVHVSGPKWSAVRVSANLAALSPDLLPHLLAEATTTIRAFLHPLYGNVSSSGWDFGRRPHASDLYRALSGLAGLDYIESLNLTCDPPGLDRQTLIYAGEPKVFGPGSDGP